MAENALPGKSCEDKNALISTIKAALVSPGDTGWAGRGVEGPQLLAVPQGGGGGHRGCPPLAGTLSGDFPGPSLQPPWVGSGDPGPLVAEWKGLSSLVKNSFTVRGLASIPWGGCEGQQGMRASSGPQPSQPGRSLVSGDPE